MIRIYKSQADQNRFVQLFLNELNVAIGFTTMLGLPIFFYSPFDYNIKILLIGLIGGIFGWLFYQRIDGKPLTSLIYSSIKYLLSPKQYFQTEISNMSDFYHNIQDNIVYTTDQIIAVIQIFPVDISILNEQEKTSFKARMGTFLHTLGDDGSIQMRVVNRLATTSDYKDHFDNLLNQSRESNANPKVMKLVTDYIENMKHKIQTQNVPFKDYFLIIPQKTGSKPNPEILKKYQQDHERLIANLKQVLESNQIICQRLNKKDLTSFYSQTISNYN
jgi:hypothetical protein